MDLFQTTLLLSTLLSSLVAGLLFAFAIVVIPGIKKLGDRDYLMAFKAMDRVIQNNQPIFMLIWIGSAVVMLTVIVWGHWRLEGFDQAYLLVAGTVFIIGVHVPTMTINVPFNNYLQSQDLAGSSNSELRLLAKSFEARWIRWNMIRMISATATTVLLLLLLARI